VRRRLYGIKKTSVLAGFFAGGLYGIPQLF